MDLQPIQNQITTQQIMTIDEVATALRISKTTAFRWMKETARLPNLFKIGRRWLMKKSDFEQLLSYKIQYYKDRY